MVADAGVSLGVVVAALVIMLTGWLWLDPAISLVIAAVVFWSGWGLARDSVNLALDGVPRGIELAEGEGLSRRARGRLEVHDLHIWAMSTNETALTAHLVRPGGNDDAFLHHVCAELSHRFNIHHATLQVEASGEVCKLAPAEMVLRRCRVGNGAKRVPTIAYMPRMVGIASLCPPCDSLIQITPQTATPRRPRRSPPAPRACRC